MTTDDALKVLAEALSADCCGGTDEAWAALEVVREEIGKLRAEVDARLDAADEERTARDARDDV